METVTPSPPSPFAGMSSGINSADIKAEEYLKIAILGKPKSGKSWFAATAPKPIRYYDWDNRKESLEGKQGLYISSTPKLTMLDVEADLSVMKANKIKKLPLPTTIVHDTVTYMNRAMEEEIFRQAPGTYRTIKVGNSTSMKVRSGWDAVNGIQRYLEYLIAEYTMLGVNFIFIFHEKDEKDKGESTPEKIVYTGQVTCDPQYLQNSLSLFNEVYRITVNGDKKYEVTCKPNWDVNASTTLLIDATEPPDIMRMIEKHKARRAQLSAKS